MDLSAFTFTETYKNGIEILFDFDIKANKQRRSKTFDGHQSLIGFLGTNPSKKLYITNDVQISDFCEEGEKLIINLTTYQEFYKNIGTNAKNRAQAFLARGVTYFSEADRQTIIANSTDIEVLERIKQFDATQLAEFLSKLQEVKGITLPTQDGKDISDIQFLDAYLEWIKNPSKQNLIIGEHYKVQIEVLENHKKFLEENLDKNETFIQNRLDAKTDEKGNELSLSDDEIKKYRRSRCLVFGLEFINHKSQGELSRKRFDILTKLSENENEHVIIELKSPCKEVFTIKEEENPNGGKSTEYYLSQDLSRSIPQISHYKNALENKSETDDDFQRIGISKGKVAKSIIIIGTRKSSDPIREENFISLQRTFSHGLEIITYTDLIKKLDTTIKNLKENL